MINEFKFDPVHQTDNAYREHIFDIACPDAFGMTHPTKENVAYHYDHSVAAIFS